jgi:large subunit ribosomal protein L15
MKVHDLQLASGKDRKRVGRGIGSGYGKTAGRGTKGQNARTGSGTRPGFEGGQNPLAKRLPKKRGFTAVSHIQYQVVSLDALAQLPEGSTSDTAALAKAGLVSSANLPAKILANGKIEKKLTLKVQGASAAAKAAIEKAGGSIEIIPLPKVPSKKATRPKTEDAPKTKDA